MNIHSSAPRWAERSGMPVLWNRARLSLASTMPPPGTVGPCRERSVSLYSRGANAVRPVPRRPTLDWQLERRGYGRIVNVIREATASAGKNVHVRSDRVLPIFIVGLRRPTGARQAWLIG